MSRFWPADVLLAIAIGAVVLTLAYLALAHPRTSPRFVQELS